MPVHHLDATGHSAMTSLQRFYAVLADALLVLHVAFVAFVVFGFLLIWLGRWRHWLFVRNFWFRAAHVAAIGGVAAEALTGIICPLTTWENRLRLLAGGEHRYQGSFLQYWLHQILFFDASETAFLVAYLAFFIAVSASFWWVPPHWPRKRTPPLHPVKKRPEESE